MRPARHFFYAQEKVEIEALLGEESRRHPDIDLYVLRPPVVLGPHAAGAKELLPARLAPLGRAAGSVVGRVPIPLRRASLFTDRPQGRSFIASDPLALHEVTWRFAREDRHLTRFAREAAPFLHTPLLLVLAGRDRIVNNRRTHDYFFRTTTAQRTMLEYPNASHTLEFEPDAEQYFADLADWIGLTVSR